MDTAISALWALGAECGDAGWNGEDAEPVSTGALANALRFIRALPPSILLPEVAAEPDGAVSLDWIAGRGRVVSLSIGTDGSSVPYAWLDGGAHGFGVEVFNGTSVPENIMGTMLKILK